MFPPFAVDQHHLQSIDCSVRSREGVDQYVHTLLHMNIISAIPRNCYMIFENFKFYLNSVQNFLDVEIARISRRESLISSASVRSRVTRSGHSAPHQVDTLGSISGGANVTVAASIAR